MAIPYIQTQPDENGFFGKYGGSFILPMLEEPLKEVAKAYNELKNSPAFIEELNFLTINDTVNN